ncbi:MBL fold metallo-hydrolase [Clostridium sp. UBA5119]|uniref:MBL fold metallo-hydrolase n=1 Tax=Clostridium sp. UBA5119 TaxID=1946366 RepID=UPI00321623EA
MKLSNKCYCLTGLSHADCFSVNAGFIIGKKETIIIDSGFTKESAQTILGYANAVAPENKVSYLINLEGHYDHIFGNSFFKSKGVKILAREGVSLKQEEIDSYIEECNNEIIIERRRKNKEAYLYFEGVKSFETDIKIKGDTELEIEGVNLKIYIANGHTDKNIMVYEPMDKVIYVADTIYSDFLPTLAFGNKELRLDWLKTLKLIEDLEPEILVPGHGRVLYREEIYKEISRHREIILKRINNQ